VNPGTVERLREHARVPLHRNAYALVFNTGLLAVAGFLYWALAARLFTASELGLAAALISTITFLSGLAQLNLRPGLARFVPVAGRRAGRLVAAAYLASSAAAVVACLLVLSGAPLFDRLQEVTAMSRDLAAAAFLVLAVLIWTLFALQDGVLIGLRRATWLPAENGAFSLAKLGLLAVLAALGFEAVTAILASWIVPMALAVIGVNLLLFFRLLPFRAASSAGDAQAPAAREVASFLAGDYVASLFNLAYVTLPPVIVVASAGPEAGGYFYVVWIIVTTMILVPRQLTVSLVVEASHTPSELSSLVRSTLLQMGRLVVPACLLVALLARVILLAFDEAYADAGSGSLAILSLAIIPYSLNSLTTGVLRVRAVAAGIIAVELALALAILGMGIPLAGSFGAIGLAIAWLIGQLLVAAVGAVIVLRPLLRPR
jgi:O-antigen/teichoic acid export membrane protein